MVQHYYYQISYQYYTWYDMRLCCLSARRPVLPAGPQCTQVCGLAHARERLPDQAIPLHLVDESRLILAWYFFCAESVLVALSPLSNHLCLCCTSSVLPAYFLSVALIQQFVAMEPRCEHRDTLSLRQTRPSISYVFAARTSRISTCTTQTRTRWAVAVAFSARPRCQSIKHHTPAKRCVYFY